MRCEIQLSSPCCLGFPAMMKFVLWTQISSLWFQLFPSEYYISNRKINNRKRRYDQNLKYIEEGKADNATQNKKVHFWMGTAPPVMILKEKAKEDIFLSFSFPSLLSWSLTLMLLVVWTYWESRGAGKAIGSWSLYRTTKIMSTTQSVPCVLKPR